MGRAVGGNFQGMYVGRGGNVEQKFGGGGGVCLLKWRFIVRVMRDDQVLKGRRMGLEGRNQAW